MRVFARIAVLLVCLLSSQLDGGEKNPDRHELLAGMLVGMSCAQVTERLDREYPQKDLGWTGSPRANGTVFLSRYRLDRETYLHLTFKNVRGRLGNLRDDDIVAEANIARFDELIDEVPADTFESIRIIHRSPAFMGPAFAPVSLIASVNHLRQLGADEAVRRLRIYHDLAVPLNGDRRWRFDLDEQRLFLILRLLFIRKDGDPRMPRIMIGAISPSVRDDDPNWPLFPLVVCGDIPFLFVTTIILGGQPESPLRHIDYCQATCVLRAQPLTPSISPIEAAEQLYGTKEWSQLFPKQFTGTGPSPYPADCFLRTSVRYQAMACLPPALTLTSEALGRLNPLCVGAKNAEIAWSACLQELQPHRLCWDANAQAFVVRIVADQNRPDQSQ